jgi:glycogen synthase
LFLGRLTVQKGADFLLDAAEKIVRHKKRVKFIFVGQGDMLAHLIEKSIELGIEQKVMFAGFMSHEEVDQAYKLADVFVMPSVSEPFGITALEAIQNGTPVIVSKQSGVGEVIKNSLKVDFWDTDELANQILAIIRYSPLSTLLARNAEMELKRLNWENQSKKIVEVYEQIQQYKR